MAPTPTKSDHQFTSQRRRKQSATSISLSTARKPNSPILFKKILEQKKSLSTEEGSYTSRQVSSRMTSLDVSSDLTMKGENSFKSRISRKRHSLTGSMGIKEMDQYVAKLKKDNFDLKLEVYHRREKQSALQEKADHVDELEESIKEMNFLIDTLQHELEQRDEALDEAVRMVLEKDEELMRLTGQLEDIRPSAHRTTVSASMANLFEFEGCPWDHSVTPNSASSQSPLAFSSPLQRSNFTARQNNATTPARPSTFTSTYDFDPVNISPSSTFDLSSPTLSVLSESSFLSVYGEEDEASFNDDDFLLDQMKPADEAQSSVGNSKPIAQAGSCKVTRRYSTSSEPVQNSPLRQQLLSAPDSFDAENVLIEESLLSQLSDCPIENEKIRVSETNSPNMCPKRTCQKIYIYNDPSGTKTTPEVRVTQIRHGLPTPASIAQKHPRKSCIPALRQIKNKQLPVKSFLPIPRNAAQPGLAKVSSQVSSSSASPSPLSTSSSNKPISGKIHKSKSPSFDALSEPLSGALSSQKKDFHKRYSTQFSKENKPLWK